MLRHATALIGLLATLLFAQAAPAAQTGWPQTKGLSHYLVIKRWHTDAEWQAENEIITQESNWDACAVNPGQHLCRYTWTGNGNACGIGQRYYCPVRWKGRLGHMWRNQCHDLQDYIARRYIDPIGALAHKRAYGWY